MKILFMDSGFQKLLAGMLVKLLEWVILEHIRHKQLGNRKK
ncbi:MAG TPA: hypothetical protein VFN30_01105 [Chitinophagaceae bacterium]|nr:hypothetical protein [Chitinophagaceae bacterium]